MVFKVTMVSSGGGEVGAAKLTGEVLDVVARLPQVLFNSLYTVILTTFKVVESMTGVKLTDALVSK